MHHPTPTTTTTLRRALATALLAVMVTPMSGCTAIIDVFFPPPPPTVRVPPPQPFPNNPQRRDDTRRSEQPRRQWQDWTDCKGNCNLPPIHGVLRLGNASKAPLIARVRQLKGSVHVDCALLLKAPELVLARALFNKATVWQLDPGRAIPLVGLPGRACNALLIDGSGFGRRLVVWGKQGPISQPSTVHGASSKRLIALTAAENGTQWPTPGNVHPAPIEVSPPQPSSCAQPHHSVGVAWTMPLPAGDVTLIEMAAAPDGCRLLELFSDSGLATWVLCTPPGSFPFKAGDSFFVNKLVHGHDLGPIDGVELLGNGVRLRVGVGAEPVYFGKGEAEVESMPGCVLSMAECGGRQRSLQLRIKHGGEEKTMRAGSMLKLSEGRALHVLRARELPVRDAACSPVSDQAGRQIESAYVEVTP